MKKERQNIGRLLMDSLTQDQLASLLDVLFSDGDMHRYGAMLKKADPDMAKTVSRIFELREEKTGKPPVIRVASDQRTIEHWDSLWRHWESLVSDVGDEKGRYAVQEEHWEPPYFNGSALADDLEPIARDMLPLLEEIYDLIDEPDLFTSALEEIEEKILSYPEWMDVESNEGCTLERNATRCVLKWLWLSSRDDEHPGKTFLGKVYEIKKDCHMVDLDENECIDFFTKLPEAVCHEIHGCIRNDGQRYDLGSIRSRWHTINHRYENLFDPARYLETCREHLAENWQYGRPLVEDALHTGNYQEADLLLEKTFSSYLRIGDKKVWYPETSLLLKEKGYFYSHNTEEEIPGLLELWAEVSTRAGNEKRSAASGLQAVISRAPEGWDAVIGEYKEYKKAGNPEVDRVIDPLFTQWKDIMAQWSISSSMRSTVSPETWINWLIEAELDASEKKEWLIEKLNAWLVHLKKDAHAFGREWCWLARLTKDLPESETVRKGYPTFFKTVLPADPEQSLLCRARCASLQKMGAGPCLSPAMEVWRNHLHTIIPDPAQSHKSDYSSHAQWMKALYELNREAYYHMLSKWREGHKRRPNLWRDMKGQGLPL